MELIWTTVSYLLSFLVEVYFFYSADDYPEIHATVNCRQVFQEDDGVTTNLAAHDIRRSPMSMQTNQSYHSVKYPRRVHDNIEMQQNNCYQDQDNEVLHDSPSYD